MTDRHPAPVVVVTGSSSGIGRAIVLRLAASGFRVVAGVRRAEDATAWAQESGQITPVLLDVTDSESIEHAVAEIETQFPAGIDGLVNNAGIAIAGPLELVPLSHWQTQFDVQVFGAVRLIQGLLPMLRRRRGRIINITSAATCSAASHGQSLCVIQAGRGRALALASQGAA